MQVTVPTAVKGIMLSAALGLFAVAVWGPKASVGGPLTMALVIFLAMMAIGIHEAWSEKRDALGWLVSIGASVGGGFVAANVVAIVIGMLLGMASFEGSLAASQNPAKYLLLAAMAALMVGGSWASVQLVNRVR